jgi:excisionase family DNA binding protein
MERKTCGIPEAANFLDVSRFTMYAWVHQHKLPYHKVGRLIKFKIEDLERFLKENRVEPINK